MDNNDLPADPRLARLLLDMQAIAQEALDQKTFGVPGCRFCREVLTAAPAIEGLSSGSHQWATQLVTQVQVYATNRQFLIVGYSNPGTDGPNHLVSMFPVNAVEGDVVVCLDPGGLTPLSAGLYWADGKLDDDRQRDREITFAPLERLLGLPTIYSDPCPLEPYPTGGSETTDFTLEGLTYRESLRELVEFWARSKEELVDAIRPW